MGKKRKSNPLTQYDSTRNPTGGNLVATAMKNGIIVRLDPLEYPIFMKAGAFVMEKNTGKGSTNKARKTGGFDVSSFMRQNKLTKKPNKKTVLAELKKGLQNMTLTYYLLNKTKPFYGINRSQKYMGASKQQAAPFYDLWKKTFAVQMQKYSNQGQKDAALAKAYSQAILDLAPFIATMSKMFKKDPALKKYHQRIAKINPLEFSAPTRKGTAKGKGKAKTQTSSKEAKSIQEIMRLARAYNKGGARGKYTKFKALYGVRNTDRIKREAAALRLKQQKKPQTKRLSSSSTVTYQRKKNKNGAFMHYEVRNGKKKRIAKAVYQKKKK